MAEVYTAAPAQNKVVPAFTVQKIDGNYTKTMAKMVPLPNSKPDRDGRLKHKLVYEQVTLPRGYLVTFPKGHSIHIDTYEKLEELGYTKTTIPILDEDGEAVGALPNVIGKKSKEVTANA